MSYVRCEQHVWTQAACLAGSGAILKCEEGHASWCGRCRIEDDLLQHRGEAYSVVCPRARAPLPPAVSSVFLDLAVVCV